MSNPFVRKLRHGARLSDEDERVLSALAERTVTYGARRDIIWEGDQPRALTLILAGWACRYKQLDDGRRQIVDLFLPGDLCEPYGILPRFMDHSLATLSPVTFVRVLSRDVRGAALASPRIDEALWWDMLLQTAMQSERIVSLGRRSASERMAHLLCELHARLRFVGLADRDGFAMPLTQSDLGETLGLSGVHVNRTLQELRGAGLIALRDRRLTILDDGGLRAVALFDPSYLHLDHDAEGRTVSSRPAGAFVRQA